MAGPAAPTMLRGYKNRVRGTGMREQGPVRLVVGYLAAGPGLLARGLIKVYRHGFSALTGFNCRHLPTCSDYADEAIGRFGLWAGGWMTLARLCRCHPWGTAGLDLVPDAPAPGARWFVPWRYGRWRGTNEGVTASPAGLSDRCHGTDNRPVRTS